MFHVRSLKPSLYVLAALILPFAGARAQTSGDTPDFHKISGLGVGATSMSTSGSSSVGASAYYISAVNRFAMETQVSMFSENGFDSYGAMVTGGYAWGPFLKPEAAAANFRSTMFYVGGGIWSSFSDVASSTDPMVIFAGNAPIGPVMVKLGYGFVLAKEANVSVMNLGVGFKFGQR